jgi:hypothetical protein
LFINLDETHFSTTATMTATMMMTTTTKMTRMIKTMTTPTPLPKEKLRVALQLQVHLPKHTFLQLHRNILLEISQLKTLHPINQHITVQMKMDKARTISQEQLAHFTAVKLFAHSQF